MTATTDRVSNIVAPVLEQMGLTLYDVDQPGSTLRVMVDAEDGVDIDALTEATREISRLLDEEEPVAGSYTLEVSSPGLERPLRTPEHFSGAVGELVKVKVFPGGDGDRRCEGILTAAEGDEFTVQTDHGPRVISLDEVSKAHTVFEWTSSSGTSNGSEEARSESTTESNKEDT